MNGYLKYAFLVCMSAIFMFSVTSDVNARNDDVTCKKHGDNYRCYDKYNKHVSDVKKTDNGYQIRDKNNRKIGSVKEQRNSNNYNVYDRYNRKTGEIKPIHSQHDSFKYKSNKDHKTMIIKNDPKNGKVQIKDRR